MPEIIEDGKVIGWRLELEGPQIEKSLAEGLEDPLKNKLKGLYTRESADEKMTGKCSTAASTAAKTVGIPGFVREVGTRISVEMMNGNTAATPTLAVNATSAGQIWHNGAIVTAAMIPAGYTIDVIWDSARWQLLNPATGATVPFAQVTTAVGTAAKTATIAGFVRVTGSIVELEFTNGNSSTSATLDVTSTGAAGIRMFDDTVPVLANIRAMYRCYFVFDGEFWRLLNPATGHLNGANLARLPTNAKDAVGAIKEIYDFTMGFVLGITFGASFRGQAYTVTGTNFSYESTVPNTLVATVVVPSANTIYAVKIGDRERTVTTGSRAGVYHLTLHDFPDKLENYTWAQIAAVAQGISDGTITDPTEYFSIGDTKDIQLTTGEILTVQIYGLNRDDIANEQGEVSGKAGITFGMKHLMSTSRRMNATDTNAGGFIGSELNTWYQGALYNSLPTDLQPLVKTASRQYTVGDGSVELTEAKLKVIMFNQVDVTGATAYPIFTDNASRIKRMSNGVGNIANWWLGNTFSNSTSFRLVNTDGSATASYNSASTLRGINFGFCV